MAAQHGYLTVVPEVRRKDLILCLLAGGGLLKILLVLAFDGSIETDISLRGISTDSSIVSMCVHEDSDSSGIKLLERTA